ncbi:MAG: DUF1732 domain-containing protein [Aquificaceae bacterium]
MTGFGFAKGEVIDYEVEVSIKGLNSKNLDINVRLNVPDVSFEFSIRELIRGYVKRGQIFVNVSLFKKEPIPELELILKNVNAVKKLLQSLDLNPSDDAIIELAFRFYVPREQLALKDLAEPIKEIVKKALEDFINSRQQEGKVLTKDITQRLFAIKDILNTINILKDSLYEQNRAKLLEKIKELELEDSPLKAGELLLLISRMDIEEEITRLFSHLEQAFNMINSDESARKLEFLIQEMHREVNTMSTKLPALSSHAVEIKTQLERIRQQLANLE